MQKAMSDYFLNGAERSPRHLENIHREEQMKEVAANTERILSRPQTTSGVLQIRKSAAESKHVGPPSMSSLYQGNASFLDYK